MTKQAKRAEKNKIQSHIKRNIKWTATDVFFSLSVFFSLFSSSYDIYTLWLLDERVDCAKICLHRFEFETVC